MPGPIDGIRAMLVGLRTIQSQIEALRNSLLAIDEGLATNIDVLDGYATSNAQAITQLETLLNTFDPP